MKGESHDAEHARFLANTSISGDLGATMPHPNTPNRMSLRGYMVGQAFSRHSACPALLQPALARRGRAAMWRRHSCLPRLALQARDSLENPRPMLASRGKYVEGIFVVRCAPLAHAHSSRRFLPASARSSRSSHPPYFAGASTAGIFESRTSLLNAATSVVKRLFSVFNSALARVAKSSYTMYDCAVG